MAETGGARSRARSGAARWAAARASWLRRFRWRGDDLGATLRDNLERELAERAGLQWLAVAFGAGCLVYLALPREPLLFALGAASLVSGLLAILAYWRGSSWRLVTIAAVALAGATAAKLHVDSLVGPEIERPAFAALTARVVDRESRVEFRPRIVVDQIRSDDIPPDAMPARIRLTLARSYGLPPLGSRIAFNARLMPVGGPIVPGGYDPHRAAFFDRIGGSGFMLGTWHEAEPAPLSADLMVAQVRAAIVDRIMAAEPGEAGAVAAALLVGERSGLSEATNESLRISGLAHILSISGLHMMLVAGTVFFLIRALLALTPRLTLTQPIGKFAALGALLAVTLYLALSGGGAATVRSYVMAAILFGAILVDRPAISMRNLAIAAFIVLTFEPEGVMEPGFQMSFAAVAALIAAWEFWRDHRIARLADDDALPGLRFLRKAMRAVAGVALTTLIAGAATAPFSAYHFERVATYSLLANLLAAPLVSAIIMPFGLLSLAAMPFGLEGLPLAVMAWGIDMMLAVSTWVASLPGAQASAPPIAPVALLVIVAGMLWLCLWRRPWRILGVPAIAIGLALIPLSISRPDILVAPDGTAVAVRDETGTLRVAGARVGSYLVEQFFDEEKPPPTETAVLTSGVSCDEVGCLLHAAGGLLVSQVTDPAAFAEDCGRAAVIVTPLRAPGNCAAPLVVDAKRLQTFGSHALRVRIEDGKPSFAVSTERNATPRPWQARGME